jgi:hypothetical protein
MLVAGISEVPASFSRSNDISLRFLVFEGDLNDSIRLTLTEISSFGAISPSVESGVYVMSASPPFFVALFSSP